MRPYPHQNRCLNDETFNHAVEILEPRVLLAADVYISEIMAINDNILTDYAGDTPDWIELHNRGDAAQDLTGWYLTDENDQPDGLGLPELLWQFPAGVTINPGEYLVIFASDKAELDTGSELHTNFQLTSSGEYLALVQSDGLTVVSSMVPGFPQQFQDISYGWDTGSSSYRYFETATPGTANDTNGVIDFVEDVTFSRARGFYSTPFVLTLDTPTDGATIYYTTDNTEPDSSSNVYTPAGITITNTTVVRAVAMKDDWKDSYIDTKSYIFLNDVLNQGPDQNAIGFPDDWVRRDGYTRDSDYEMDPDIVNDPQWSSQMIDALMQIPSVSLSIDPYDLFDSQTGIFANSKIWSDDIYENWEKKASAEFIDPTGTVDFQINAGARITGELATWEEVNHKYGIRLAFRSEYGATKLETNPFPDSDVDEYNTVILRPHWGRSWLRDPNVQWAGDPTNATYLEDTLGHDMYYNMSDGEIGVETRFVHMYVDGLYWGLYQMLERPDEHFHADHYGGEPEDWDIMKAQVGYYDVNGNTRNGTRENWDYLFSFFNFNGTNQSTITPISDTDYEIVKQYLDIPAFIDYMITEIWMSNYDWPEKNWYAASKRGAEGQPPEIGFRFYTWDSEATHNSVSTNHSNLTGGNDTGPVRLYQRLRRNDQFALEFADHVHKHFFNGGELTPEANLARLAERVAEIDLAIIGESARWGDYASTRVNNPMDKDDWLGRVAYFEDSYMPNRSDYVLGQFMDLGLYPQLDAPVFSQHGGSFAPGYNLTMTAPDGGIIYYTLDGSDPRIGDPGEPSIISSDTLLDGNDAKTVLVPSVANGGNLLGDSWKGGSEPFDDSSWTSGTGGVGYETTSGYDPYFNIDVESEMDNIMESVYIRTSFNVDADDLANYNYMKMWVRYDDGFVAYLNGTRILAQNAPDEVDLTWNDGAEDTHSDSVAVNWIEYDLSASDIAALQAGENILAVQGLNSGASSSDFLINVRLEVGELSTGNGDLPQGVNPNAIEYTGQIPLYDSGTIKARVLANGEFSAINVADFYVDQLPTLVVSEIHYNPTGGNNYEFIELQNVGDQPINLFGVRFDGSIEGIEFTFPDMVLQPGERTVVVENEIVFNDFVGDDSMVAGQFEGRLSNGGEQITLLDGRGVVIQQFTYSDTWYPSTDGGGKSLTAVDTSADPLTWDLATAWAPSSIDHGTPGTDDVIVGDLPGDANHDGTVGLLDLDILGSNWGTETGATWEMGDFSGDGAVGLLDLDILGGNWGVSAAMTAQPAAAWLLMEQPAALDGASDLASPLDGLVEDDEEEIVTLF